MIQTLVFSVLLIQWEKSTSKRFTQILVLVSVMLLAGIIMGIFQAI